MMIFREIKLGTKTNITHNHCYRTVDQKFIARTGGDYVKTVYVNSEILDIEVIWGQTITEIPIVGE